MSIGKIAKFVKRITLPEKKELAVVDWGLISTTSATTRRIEIEVSAPAKIRSSLDAIQVQPNVLPSSGRYQVTLLLDLSRLMPGALIEAGLTIESDEEERFIRVTGSVDDIRLESSHTSSTIMDKPWALIHKLDGRMDRVYAVAFVYDGRTLVCGGDEGKVVWWDPASGERLASSEPFDSDVRCLGASRDGKLIAVGLRSGIICLQEASTRRTLWMKRIHEGYISGLCFSPDSAVLAAGSGDRSISILKTESGTLLYPPIKPSVEKAGIVTSIALSANGLVLASSSQIGNRIMLWEVRTGKLLRELVGHGGTVWTLAFSLDGYLLASGSGDKTVRFWDTENGTVSSRLEGFRKDVFCVALSPDGRLLATASAEPKVRVWHVDSGRRLASIESGERWMRDLAFSPRQHMLAGASDDGHVYVWGVGDAIY